VRATLHALQRLAHREQVVVGSIPTGLTSKINRLEHFLRPHSIACTRHAAYMPLRPSALGRATETPWLGSPSPVWPSADAAAGPRANSGEGRPLWQTPALYPWLKGGLRVYRGGAGAHPPEESQGKFTRRKPRVWAEGCMTGWQWERRFVGCEALMRYRLTLRDFT
jgi:hypothetical protein